MVRGTPKRHLYGALAAAYKRGHDVRKRDHYSNYMPGALYLSRRDKAFEPSRRPDFFRHSDLQGRDR